MRSGYPAPWTLGDLLKSGQLGFGDDARRQHWAKVCGIVVDGHRLYDTRPLRRTASAHEIRYRQKFSEVMIAAHALARLDATRIVIDTGVIRPHERPDLRVLLDNERVGVEVVEVHPNAHAANAAIDLNIAINEAVDRLPLRPQFINLHIGRMAGRNDNSAVPAKIRGRLVNIIVDMLRSGSYSEPKASRIVNQEKWPGAALGYTLYVSRSLAPFGYIQFDDSACSFNPDALIRPTLVTLNRKRAMAKTYNRTDPLWLILGLTEQRGLFSSSLQKLAELAATIEPFERVIAHDGMMYVTHLSGKAA